MKISQLTENTSPATTDYIPVNVSNSTKKVSIANLKIAMGVPTYTKYVALLTQSGTSAPTATVLENTLGGTVVWTRVSQGQYRGTLTGAFTASKTWCQFTFGTYSTYYLTAYLTRENSNSVFLEVIDTNLGASDSAITNSSIEIRVYP